MGWNERSDPDMRTANFCDVYREGVYMFALLVNLDVPLSTGQPLDYSHMSTAVSQHCLWPDTSISSPTFTGLKHKE